jgi:hypothetical protein
MGGILYLNIFLEQNFTSHIRCLNHNCTLVFALAYSEILPTVLIIFVEAMILDQ